MLKLLIQRFGVGKWGRILECNYLPGKTISQLVNETIKLIGQKQIRQFQGVCIDPFVLRKVVMKREGTRRIFL